MDLVQDLVLANLVELLFHVVDEVFFGCSCLGKQLWGGVVSLIVLRLMIGVGEALSLPTSAKVMSR